MKKNKKTGDTAVKQAYTELLDILIKKIKIIKLINQTEGKMQTWTQNTKTGQRGKTILEIMSIFKSSLSYTMQEMNR